MTGNLLLRVLTVAAPTVASFVAFNQIPDTTVPAEPVLGQVISVEAQAQIVTNFDTQTAPAVPVTVTAKDENGQDQMVQLTFPLQQDLASTIKQQFQEKALPIFHSVENALIDGTSAKDPKVRQASMLALPGIQAAVPYRVMPDVKLPERIEKKVEVIAKKTFSLTGHRVVVTSAHRSPEAQAAAMKTKLDLGESPRRLYANKRAAGEIENAYRYAKRIGLDGDGIRETMAMVIDRQIDNGVYISRHLKEGAVDIRSRDLGASEKWAVREAAHELGAKVLLESTPPHFHLEL